MFVGTICHFESVNNVYVSCLVANVATTVIRSTRLVPKEMQNYNSYNNYFFHLGMVLRP